MISVVIPVINEEKRIAKCLESIKNQTYTDYEIIMVDGGSKDRTVEIAKKYTDKIFFDNCKSAGDARNVGAKKAKGEIIAFIDGDCFADREWLHLIHKNFEKGCVAVGGILETYDGRLIDNLIFFSTNNMIFRVTKLFHYYQLIGNNCAYSRKLFLKEGGFNENITLLDDLDMGLRMKKYGKMNVDSGMVVHASARRLQQTGVLLGFVSFFKAYKNYKYGKNKKMYKNYFKGMEH